MEITLTLTKDAAMTTARRIGCAQKALDEVQKLASERGALKTMPLAVSGAFHTPLMQPAREKLAAVLEQVEVRAARVS